MMIIEPTYNIGEIVFVITDKEQDQRIITALILCPAKDILYEVTCGTTASKHYDFELSKEKNYALSQ